MDSFEGENVATPHHLMSAMSAGMFRELRELECLMVTPALTESIRLIESEKFDQLTDRHIREVAEYRAIELEEEWFFERAFSTGKEAAASLAFAQMLGREVVLDDLQRLHTSLLGTDGACWEH